MRLQGSNTILRLRHRAGCSSLAAPQTSLKQPRPQAEQLRSMMRKPDPCQRVMQRLRSLRHEQRCRCQGMQLPGSYRAPARPSQGFKNGLPQTKKYARQLRTIIWPVLTTQTRHARTDASCTAAARFSRSTIQHQHDVSLLPEGKKVLSSTQRGNAEADRQYTMC